MKLLDKNKISEAAVNSEYFPYFHIENVFSSETDQNNMVKNFPEIRSGGSYPKELLKDGLIKELINELEGKEFKEILESKFEVNLENSEVVTTLRGYSRAKDGKIHTDSKSKILTILLYLNPNWKNDKGNLKLLKENNSLDNFIKEISSEYGNLVAFKVTDNCWHGFEPFEGKRLSIQLNYIYPEALSSHNYRHKISAFLKKLIKR